MFTRKLVKEIILCYTFYAFEDKKYEGAHFLFEKRQLVGLFNSRQIFGLTIQNPNLLTFDLLQGITLFDQLNFDDHDDSIIGSYTCDSTSKTQVGAQLF